MTNYKLYSDLPKELSTPLDPQSYHLHVAQGKQQELVRLKENEKYSKTLDRLTWLNACSSGLGVASGISSVAMLSMLIGLPVSIPLGAVSLWLE